ncbi:MAG: hypothetical protein A2Y17_12890 [Clostridiales bacterium GWF2_38_85]|nr:MAG: hypothetical protein A2Y17_12890 [Clostridiales bacterium GWF2_38_85]HBL84155.1 hypothetical protein [Clostridiales bacterium]
MLKNLRNKKKHQNESDEIFLIEDCISEEEKCNNLITLEMIEDKQSDNTKNIFPIKNDFQTKNEITSENELSKFETASEASFLSSLENFSSDKIDYFEIPKKKKKNNAATYIRAGVLVACVGTFIFSGIKIINWYVDSIKANNIYNQIQDEFNRTSALSAAKVSIKNSKTLTLNEMIGSDVDGIDFTPPELLSLYQDLKKKLNDAIQTGKYPDTIGWIKIPGTRIDYLIVQGIDNEQYLTKTPDGIENKHGSIFADFRTDKIYSNNRHIVLYGHNMSDGSMFSAVEDFFWPYSNWDLFNTTEIQVINPDGLYIYKPFSMYKATKGNNYIKYEFENDGQWVEFLQNIYDQSLFAGWTSNYKKYINKSTKILTFSTCTNNMLDEHERYVLHAVLVDIIRDDD